MPTIERAIMKRKPTPVLSMGLYSNVNVSVWRSTASHVSSLRGDSAYITHAFYQQERRYLGLKK